ncbi:uncharacterized protein LOC142476314 [Ascaphus truei]|uniref:uncharacterized protein LOC142476314 n=1 Tax=Ascaphus truei TaxID=8439 RepID=UPI003F595DEC
MSPRNRSPGFLVCDESRATPLRSRSKSPPSNKVSMSPSQSWLPSLVICEKVDPSNDASTSKSPRPEIKESLRQGSPKSPTPHRSRSISPRKEQDKMDISTKPSSSDSSSEDSDSDSSSQRSCSGERSPSSRLEPTSKVKSDPPPIRRVVSPVQQGKLSDPLRREPPRAVPIRDGSRDTKRSCSDSFPGFASKTKKHLPSSDQGRAAAEKTFPFPVTSEKRNFKNTTKTQSKNSSQSF